ncbi:MAG: guanylate kinase [Marinifilaceae bacterium]|jgi:guanylate kinase|nr:guanylate kinase [Marinifilaceae bacterium]
MSGKLIIFSAPSGAGKSTILNEILEENFNLEFSISATSRKPRGQEKHGKEYYFLSADEFRTKVENDEFVEWEEVYENCFYGTLKSEVDRIIQSGKNVIFDIDVVGGINIKNMYKENALSIFIMPPSVEILKQRLINRGTDSKEFIEERVNKASFEMEHANQFDTTVVNSDLNKAILDTRNILNKFLK